MSMKNSNGTKGNRNRDLPASSAMPPMLSAQQPMCVLCAVGDTQTDASSMATRHREGETDCNTRRGGSRKGAHGARPPQIIVEGGARRSSSSNYCRQEY